MFEEQRPNRPLENPTPSYHASLPVVRPSSEVETDVKDLLSWIDRTEQKDMPEYLVPKMEALQNQIERRVHPQEKDHLETGGAEL